MKVLILLLVTVVGIAIVVGFKSVRYGPPLAEINEQASTFEVDKDTAARNLSGAIKIRTISRNQELPPDATAFKEFHERFTWEKPFRGTSDMHLNEAGNRRPSRTLPSDMVTWWRRGGQWATPPDDDEFELILPTGYAGLYDEKIAPLAEKDRLLFQYHIVSRGETLSHLSQRYGVSISAISDTNQLNNQHMVHIGQSLIIPLSGIPVPETSVARVSPPAQAPDVYQIRRGDTLSEIAANFGLAVNDIKSWNDMSSNLLIAGDTLRLRTTPEVLRSTQITPDSIASVTADKRVYNVRSGDTLSQIASSHRISVDAIRTWNLERDLSIIRPGDEITIYCTAATVC